MTTLRPHAVDRWSLLALLRFVLASVVAMDHLDEHMLLGRLGAFEAVLAFLVISGYSVTVSMAQRPEGFLRRRLVRVFPVYIACLALTLLVTAIVEHKALPGAAEIAANVLMLNQLVTRTSILGPAWSLALECWFYALLPLLAAQPARRLRQLSWLSFAAFSIFTIGRTLLQLPYYAGVGFGANALLLAFAWLTGSRLARTDAAPATALRDLRWMFAGHILLDALIQFGHRLKRHEAPRFAIDDLPDFCFHALTLWIVLRCLAYAITPQPTPRMRSRWMNSLGDWSYPLYLVHVPVYAIVASIAGVASMATFGALAMTAFGVALAAAVVLHHAVERRWRRPTSASRVGALAGGSRARGHDGTSQTIPKVARCPPSTCPEPWSSTSTRRS